jgi:phosphoglycolate phosphatase
LPQHAVADYRYFVGEGREAMASYALPLERRDPSTLQRLVDFINVDYTAHWRDHTALYPGVSDLLDGLSARGILIAVLSNKPHAFTLEMVTLLLSRWHFGEVRGALPGVAKKPDCSQALQIARTLKVSPQEFVYVGDSGIDMQTAVGAGMYPAGALWGFREAAELREGGAQLLLEHPTNLLKFLK